MAKIGILRCEKNGDRCPMTNCLRCLQEKKEGFARYADAELTGILSCTCPGDGATKLAGILKSKGADVIHLCTCTFAKKTDQGWALGNGFCDDIDRLAMEVAAATGLPVVKGTAHLPAGYTAQVFE